MDTNLNIPTVGFCGYSGTGKTTLLKNLLPVLKSRGLRVAVVKHAHHDFDVDLPGKDSYELRKSGADQVVVGSKRRWVLMVETPECEEPRVEELVGRCSDVDIILVEGFKLSSLPKIEIHRTATGFPPLYPNDDSIIAVATDSAELKTNGLIQFAIDDVAAIADFVCHRFING